MANLEFYLYLCEACEKKNSFRGWTFGFWANCSLCGNETDVYAYPSDTPWDRSVLHAATEDDEVKQ